MKKKVRLNKTVDNVIKIICAECNNTTKHKVVTSVDIDIEEISETLIDEFYSSSHYQIVECLGCEKHSFRYEHTNSEDYHPDGEPYMTDFIYPDRKINSIFIKNILDLPFSIERIYKETIHCYNSENYTLCGAGLRALVEGLCNEHLTDKDIEDFIKAKGSKKGGIISLFDKINCLGKKGTITIEIADILHELRFLGNDAVHELAVPHPIHLKLGIDIIENIFDNLYTLPSNAKKMKRTRMIKDKLKKDVKKNDD